MIRGVTLLLGPLLVSSSAADIVAVSLGTAPPPPTLGGYQMTMFPPEDHPVFTEFREIPSPLGGHIALSHTAQFAYVHLGWGRSWSHGYEGHLYRVLAPVELPPTVTLTLPPETRAIYFYVSQRLGAAHAMGVTADDGPELVQFTGTGEVRGFGFYVDDLADPPIHQLRIVGPTSTTWAMAEFAIAVPEPGALMLLSAGLLVLRRR